MIRRTALFLGALALTLAPAGAAFAGKPVSTYTVALTATDGDSVSISVDEFGNATVDVEVDDFIFECQDTRFVAYRATGASASSASLTVDRKLDTATASATVQVTVWEVGGCVGLTPVQSVKTIDVGVDATATLRADRGRNAEGDRQIQRAAAGTFTVDVSTSIGTGTITETISN